MTIETTEQNTIALKLLAKDILRFGDLLVIGNKSVGKTNVLMTLTSNSEQTIRIVLSYSKPSQNG